MCREFVSASVPKSSVPAADMCVLKFPGEDDPTRTTAVRKEQGGGLLPPPADKENGEELAVPPKKVASAPPVSFAAIADLCGSTLLLNIGRKISPCPPLGAVLANPLRTLVSPGGVPSVRSYSER